MTVPAPAPVVLLVDDNPSMRALIRGLVEGAGSAVYECADGETAVDLYGRVRPDVVLMDVSMGGMDGLAATRAIRRSDPHARVIMVTEHGEEQYQRAAEAAGASGYLLKSRLMDLPGLLAAP